MTKTLTIICLLTFCGCNDPSYIVSKDGIKSNKFFQDGFDLIEIFVSEFNEDGRPTKYSDGISVFCGPTKGFSGYFGDSVFSEKEKELISLNRKIMDTIMKLNGNILGGEGHDKRSMEYVESEVLIDSIINKRFPFKPQKRVMFFEKSENYKWVFTTDENNGLKFYDYSKIISDTLPFALKINQWYLLNFSNASNIIDKVFFLVKKDGKIQQYNYYKVKFGV